MFLTKSGSSSSWEKIINDHQPEYFAWKQIKIRLTLDFTEQKPDFIKNVIDTPQRPVDANRIFNYS